MTDAMARSSKSKQYGQGSQETHQLARHGPRLLPNEHRRAHEGVGRDGAQECHFGFEMDLVHGNTLGVAQEGLRLEQAR
jgi:hypothetical protein